MIIEKYGLLQDRNLFPLFKHKKHHKNEIWQIFKKYHISIDILFCGHYNEYKMKEDFDAIELQKIYRQADAEGRKKIASVAAQLLEAQKSFGKDKGRNKKEQKKMKNDE